VSTKVRLVALLLAALATVTSPPAGAGIEREWDDRSPGTFAAAADAAAATVEGRFYHAPGRWNMCVPGDCGTAVRDWGADAMAYTLFLRHETATDPGVAPIMTALAKSAPLYGPCVSGACTMWSDVPMWDAIAAARIFEVTGEKVALEKAERAFAAVDDSNAFALGACPAIDYQQPAGGKTALKTLETDSNYIKAALLLAHLTGDERYVRKAEDKYAAVRRYFLDPHVALYSVYVFDDGSACRQLPQRFFASVNGNMIYDGLALAAQTGVARYRREAFATAHAVASDLNDASGVYANLQADNDVAEPLVEAMYDLGIKSHAAFARRWLVTAAAAARPAADGLYGRFFDGPPPPGPVSAWSASGGLALAIAAGALTPPSPKPEANDWRSGRFIPDAVDATPATIAFSGRAIALIGTIGDVCCEAGHVRVFIDGRETFNNTGIWQNKSPASHRLPDSVLFSWRWPTAGPHTIAFEPGIANAKEGGSFIHLAGYELVP
jgi:hypothetical protein